VQEPSKEIAASTGLHYFSTANAGYTPNVACLSTPPAAGTTQTVTLKGYVKLFSSGGDSAGVKVEIFKEGTDGALGALVGTAVTTSKDDVADPPQMPLVTWLQKCPPEGCKFRSFTYAGIPTETPLIIKTSDASGSGTWADLYDYNIYFANSPVDASMNVAYDPSALAATDIGVVAATVGATIKSGKGLIAGEVHDCGDVRLSERWSTRISRTTGRCSTSPTTSRTRSRISRTRAARAASASSARSTSRPACRFG
jgi:hypothetical protein